MPRVMHFEIPADDPARACRFYSGVFGWDIKQWDGSQPYWLVSTGPKDQPGIDGGIHPRQHPGQGVVNTVVVTNLEEALAAVETNGGTIAVPKMPIPTIGWLAYCHDTEGNTFGVLQPDPGAK